MTIFEHSTKDRNKSRDNLLIKWSWSMTFLKKTSYGMPGLKKVKFRAPVQTKNLCYLISIEKKINRASSLQKVYCSMDKEWQF